MPTVRPRTNFWPDSKCARAFWSQQETPAYRRLLADTAAWLDPGPGERWLDLGCGSGALTRALWAKGGGALAEVTGADCAAVNDRAYRQLRDSVRPPAHGAAIRFVHADFSAGLAPWADEHFDGVVSGLAIQYAECYSESQGRWTTEAYDRLLAEVYRVLRPGGRFVFSVNVPEPSWGRVALASVHGFFQARRPIRYLQRSLRMLRYGRWLKREARRGRFHYLPGDTIRHKLAATGFTLIEVRLTFARQAYLFRCRKPA